MLLTSASAQLQWGLLLYCPRSQSLPGLLQATAWSGAIVNLTMLQAACWHRWQLQLSAYTACQPLPPQHTLWTPRPWKRCR